MISCVIVDDEIDAQLTIEHMLIRHCSEVVLLGKAESVKSAVDIIKTMRPEFVFLDIQLGDESGFDILNQLNGIELKIIFTTAHENFALQAIKIEAIDYLLKPINPLELKVAVTKVKELISQEKKFVKENRIAIKEVKDSGNNKAEVVLSSDIIRCQAEVNYTYIYFRDKRKILAAKTLKHFETELSDYGFIRVHQSHLVNINEISSINRSKATLQLKNSQELIPYSRTYKRGLLDSGLFHVI